MTLYGISNCDSVKKAQKWLKQQKCELPFHDFRKQGLPVELLERWLELTQWQNLLNKRSTSFRNLSDADKENIDQTKAKQLMLANPTLIKRPILSNNNKILIGFNEAEYQAWFSHE